MAEPTETLVTSVVEKVGIHDPTFVGLAWVVGIVTLVIAIGKPIRDYLRSERKANIYENADEAKGEAEAALYRQLAEQLKEYRELANTGLLERADLFKRIGQLELRSHELDEAREMILHLKEKLDEKDVYIFSLVEQNQQERARFLAILEMKDGVLISKDEIIQTLTNRLHDLELRVTRDEVEMVGFKCPMISERIS